MNTYSKHIGTTCFNQINFILSGNYDWSHITNTVESVQDMHGSRQNFPVCSDDEGGGNVFLYYVKLINLNSPSRSAHARIRTKGFTLSPAFLVTGRATQFSTSSQARKSHFEKPNSASQQWHLQIYSRINEWVFERTNDLMNGESYIYGTGMKS